MARGQDETDSLRLGRRESERLIAALLVSLCLHLVIWVIYHTGDKWGWWKGWHLPFTKRPLAQLQQKPPPPPVEKEEEPEMYIDVSQADADAPDKAKYYSSKNSHAANPDVGNQNQVQINGHQTDYMKTEDVQRAVKRTEKITSPSPDKETAEGAPKTAAVPNVTKVQPTVPPVTPSPQSQNEQASTPQTPGETDLAQPKAPPGPPAQASMPTQPRPRTIKQALAQRNQTPGLQVQQEGGVPKRALVPTVDAKATSFGAYNAGIIEAISQRWYDLLDKQRFAQDRTGKVVLRFKLKPDGSVIEVQTLENTVGDLLAYLCQESVEEAAPFAKWPPDMVRMIGTNYCEFTFTFYYY